jgi:hypothetical protein
MIIVNQANGVTFFPELDALIEATFYDQQEGFWSLNIVFGEMKMSLVSKMHAWKQL